MNRTRTRFSLALTAALAAATAAVPLAAGSPAAAASGRGSGPVEVRLLDDCDRDHFPAEAGCTGDGGTTFDELLQALLEEGEHGAWRNSPEHLTVDHGRAVRVVNRGGEPHTFSEVAQFGGGCVEELNQLLGLEAVPECDPSWPAGVVVPGASVGVGQEHLHDGTHRFQCLIHPWMRTTLTVRPH